MLVGQINGQEKYVTDLEPLLYPKAVFQPGITYTTKYEVADAISAQVYKLGAGEVPTPTTGVGKYIDEEASDELITIPYNNRFSKSKTFYTVQGQVVPYDIGLANLNIVSEQVRVGRDRSILGCVVNEFDKFEDNTAITASNIKNITLAMLEQLYDNDAAPNIALCSNQVYTTVRSIARDEFDVDMKNQIAAQGVVGMWQGLMWVPTSIFKQKTVQYYDRSGKLNTVSIADNADLAIYDFDALSVLEHGTDIGIYDAHPSYNGSAAQIEVYTGMTVTNPVRGLVHSSVADA